MARVNNERPVGRDMKIELILDDSIPGELTDKRTKTGRKPNKGTIIWETASNPFIKRWEEIFEYEIGIDPQHWAYHYALPQSWKEWDQTEIDDITDEIKKNIRLINGLRDPRLGLEMTPNYIKYPITEMDIHFDKNDPLQGQSLINTIHRYFTTHAESIGMVIPDIQAAVNSWHNMRWHLNHNRKVSQGGPGSRIGKKTSTFSVAYKEQRLLLELCENLNQLCHRAEKYLPNDRKAGWPTERVEYEVKFSSVIWHDYMFEEYKFQAFGPGHDVWVPITQILGKFWPVSYFDYDDPSEHDCWAGKNFTKSFALGDRSFMANPKLIEWAKSYGIEYMSWGFPLGDIIKGKELIKNIPENGIREINIL